jgi:hypothetical protein
MCASCAALASPGAAATNDGGDVDLSGAWAALIGLAMAVASRAVRRRYAESMRVRLCMTVAIATAIGLIAAGVVLVLLLMVR